MKIGKQKIFEILLTALISAMMAFLQSIIAQHAGINTGKDIPVIAGTIGAVIRICRA